MDEAPPHSSAEPDASQLPTTRWSLVCQACGTTSASARRALDELCRLYWYPLYCFVRRRGYQREDAEDLVQGFFVQLFKFDLFSLADPTRGRLRGFLLANLRFFLADEGKRAAALKRGGDIEFVPLDFTGAEERFQPESSSDDSPERSLDRAWAATLLDETIATLRETWVRNGKGELFDALQPHLVAPLTTPEASRIGAQFALSAGNVKVNLSRLKDAYSVRLRQQVAETVASEEEVEPELAELRAALA